MVLAVAQTGLWGDRTMAPVSLKPAQLTLQQELSLNRWLLAGLFSDTHSPPKSQRVTTVYIYIQMNVSVSFTPRTEKVTETTKEKTLRKNKTHIISSCLIIGL